MDKIIAWLINIGERMFKFTGTIAAKAYSEYGDLAVEIVTSIAIIYASSISGTEKKALAMQELRKRAPKLLTAAEWLVETVVQMAYADYMSGLLQKDTDGDGIPDWKDICPEVGAPEGGCVTDTGCPDSDCDNVADNVDKCPTQGKEVTGKVDENGCPV